MTSRQLRPVDILTTAAVLGCSAAFDVYIASPNAAAAQGDAAVAAFKGKLRYYRGVIPELAAAGIAFRPLVWTADARPTPTAMRTLKYAAQQAAARMGTQGESQTTMARWKNELTIAIMRRRAAMSRAVVPRRTAWEEWMLAGVAEQPPTDAGRRSELDVADDVEAAFRRSFQPVRPDD